VGSWLGGKLTDRFGFYKVMKISLLFTGIVFIALQFVNTFIGFCLGIFVVMLVADTFRPAIFVALNTYSKPENKTRSVTLIRLAINLGFSAGPAVAGLIITHLSYSGLFWVDGITCFLATVLLVNVLHPKKAKAIDAKVAKNPVSVYSDKPFWMFFISMFIFGFVFLQFISTIPLYYKDGHQLTELQIGLLLGLNGFLIFMLEMPLIKWLEETKYSKEFLMFIGFVLVGISFLILNYTGWMGILVISVVLVTIGEMIVFPFSNAFAIERSKKGKQGEYMAFYSVAFSASHIFSHNAGMQMIDAFGYTITWNVITLLSVVGLGFVWILMRMIRKENHILKKKVLS